MKAIVAAMAVTVILTSTSLALGSPAGLGGGSHATGPKQASAPSVDFGADTNRWGPNLKRKRPADIGEAFIDQQHIACPCDVVADPLKKHVVGGNPENLETELKHGITDQFNIDHKTGSASPTTFQTTFQMEVDLTNAAWGAHYDPSAPTNEKADNGQSAH